jgi:hypothetical protein
MFSVLTKKWHNIKIRFNYEKNYYWTRDKIITKGRKIIDIFYLYLTHDELWELSIFNAIDISVEIVNCSTVLDESLSLLL